MTTPTGERPAPAATGRGAENEHGKALSRNGSTPTPKIWRAVALLSTGLRVNRWDAASLIHDSCWNSTVAEIERRMGLTVSREETVIRGYAGVRTRCSEYWLDREQQAKAKAMLQARNGQEAA